jgi:hypothetical protein
MPSNYSKLVVCLFVHDGSVLLSIRALIQNRNKRKLSVRSLAHILAEDFEHDDDDFVAASVVVVLFLLMHFSYAVFLTWDVK